MLMPEEKKNAKKGNARLSKIPVLGGGMFSCWVTPKVIIMVPKVLSFRVEYKEKRYYKRQT